MSAPRSPTASVIAALLKAVGFYVTGYVFTSEMIALNLHVGSRIPWWLFTAIAFLGLWAGSVGRWWSGYNLFTLPKPASSSLRFIAFASIFCLASELCSASFLSFPLGTLKIAGATPQIAVTYAVSAPLLAAILEEISFRGILQGNLRSVLGTSAAAWITGILFVIAHGFRPAFVAQLGVITSVALVAGSSAAVTKTVSPGIWIHCCVNVCLAAIPLMGFYVTAAQLSNEVGLFFAFVAVISAFGVYRSLQKLGKGLPAPIVSRTS
jgi:membrane protease YdiL (CAAX protease family)